MNFSLRHRDLEDITAIGVNEVTSGKGHQIRTLVYQIDSGRKLLLGVVRGRDTRSRSSFFETFGTDRCARTKVVCSDMRRPYLIVIAAMLPAALNGLDLFHIAKKLGEAAGELGEAAGELGKAAGGVRPQEAKQRAAEGYEPFLMNSRYRFLKRRSDLTIRQAAKLRNPLKYELNSIRALALKESFDAFWQYDSPHWARWSRMGAPAPCAANSRP